MKITPAQLAKFSRQLKTGVEDGLASLAELKRRENELQREMKRVSKSLARTLASLETLMQEHKQDQGEVEGESK